MQKNRFGHVPQFDRDIRPGENFPLVVLDGDPGDRNDPERCVFARCAKRILRTDNAWFGLSVAYIQIGSEIVRAHYTPKMYAAIHEFEAGGILAPGIYQLREPRPSETIEGKRAKNARLRSGDTADDSDIKTRKYTKSAKWEAAQKKRGAWHAPRGWGRGITENGDPVS